MPGIRQKGCAYLKNVQLKAAGLFKHMTFKWTPSRKGLMVTNGLMWLQFHMEYSCSNRRKSNNKKKETEDVKKYHFCRVVRMNFERQRRNLN